MNTTVIICWFLLHTQQVSVQLVQWRCEQKRNFVTKLCLKRDALRGPFLFTVVLEIYGGFHINLFGESALSLLPPSHTHSHRHTHTRLHVCAHLGMNERLTFRTASTVRSSSIQIGPPPPSPTPHPFTPPPYSFTAAAVLYWYHQRMQMNRQRRCQAWTKYHTGCRMLHDRDGNIEYLATRTTPEFNTAGGEKNTHSYSRHIGWEIPGKKTRHSNEMRLCLLGLWREKRGRVTQKKERATPMYTPPFSALSHPSLRLQLRATPTRPPTHPARARARTFSL